MIARFVTILFIVALLAGAIGPGLMVTAKSRRTATPKLVQEFSLLPDSSFTYKSNKQATGTDSYTYVVQETTGLTALETVSIQVKGKQYKKPKK